MVILRIIHSYIYISEVPSSKKLTTKISYRGHGTWVHPIMRYEVSNRVIFDMHALYRKYIKIPGAQLYSTSDDWCGYRKAPSKDTLQKVYSNVSKSAGHPSEGNVMFKSG